MTTNILELPVNDRSSATTIAGYRLQMTLVDLVDLTMQAQHVRWNVENDESVRAALDDFDALARAAADTVAARLRMLGIAPDGRVGTAYQDLLFEPLQGGPIAAGEAVATFGRRLTQFGARLADSIMIVGRADQTTADLLEVIQAEVATWTESFETT